MCALFYHVNSKTPMFIFMSCYHILLLFSFSDYGWMPPDTYTLTLLRRTSHILGFSFFFTVKIQCRHEWWLVNNMDRLAIPSYQNFIVFQAYNNNTKTQQQYKQQHPPVDGRASCRAPTITHSHNNNINSSIYLWMGEHLARHQQLLAKRGLKAGRRPSTDWFVWRRKIFIKSYWIYLYIYSL